MKITSKDRSMLLLIATIAVFLWFLFAHGINFVTTPSYKNSQTAKLVKLLRQTNMKPINLSRYLKDEDLKSKIIVLAFYNDECAQCIKDIAKLQNIKVEHGNKVAIIGIYRKLKDDSTDHKKLKKIVLRSDIDFAVVVDKKGVIFNGFLTSNSYPRYVAIDPRGVVMDVANIDDLSAIKQVAKKFSSKINASPLPISLERNNIVQNVLSFPSKIDYAKKFKYQSYQGEAFFVSNSGSANIVAFKRSGQIIERIGSKNSGFLDSDIKRSKFKSPTGLLFNKNVLYVADTLNHAIRKVDFKKNKVVTLIGDGQPGQKIESGEFFANQVQLNMPSDIEFFPDSKNLVIVNSGTGQMLKFNLKSEKIEVVAEDIGRDVKDISSHNKKLYFVDANDSSLKVANSKFKVSKIFGGDHGYQSGKSKSSKMNHPTAVFANRNGVYVADKLNHKIRKYQPSNKIVKTIFGGAAGQQLGEESRFSEPDGLIIVKNHLFVVDSNNNRIVDIDFRTMKSRLLDVIPAMKLPREGFLEYLPNLEKLDLAKVKSGYSVPLKVNFEKGWKINEKGPSFLNLLQIVGKNSANLVKTYDWNMIKDNVVFLPKLKSGKKYVIQGTIYYCEDKKNSLCFISSYEQEVRASNDGKKILNIEI